MQVYFKYKNSNIKCFEFNVFNFTFDKIELTISLHFVVK